MLRPAFLVTAVLLCIVQAARGVHAQGTAELPGMFSCQFEIGHAWSYDVGKFQDKPPTPLAFEVTDIDLEGQSAKLATGGKPSGTLRIVRALNANHFLEVANEGFLNLTTIYDLDPATGVYPAVHSRHFGIFGQPVFAQYAGTCRAQ